MQARMRVGRNTFALNCCMQVTAWLEVGWTRVHLCSWQPLQGSSSTCRASSGLPRMWSGFCLMQHVEEHCMP
jgi:hypothetical protein